MDNFVNAMCEIVVDGFEVALNEAIQFVDVLDISMLPIENVLTDDNEVACLVRGLLDSNIIVEFLLANASICEVAGLLSNKGLSLALDNYFSNIDNDILEMWFDDICKVAKINGLEVEA